MAHIIQDGDAFFFSDVERKGSAETCNRSHLGIEDRNREAARIDAPFTEVSRVTALAGFFEVLRQVNAREGLLSTRAKPGVEDSGLRCRRFGPYRRRRRRDQEDRNGMKARVTVTLKSGVLDPQGKAIEGALKSLGVAGVASVRQGKVFDIEIEGRSRKEAEAALKQAADKLLANTLIEDYRVDMK